MAVRTKDELLGQLKVRIGDDASDDTLTLLEDITDTFDDYESKTADTTNWKDKYEELDASWKKKYRDRFFNTTKEEDDTHEEDDVPKKYSFDSLFETK